MIGVIADDVTGATDVAAALSRAGLRTVLALTADVPEDAAVASDAIVVGLKTRSIPAPDAVAESLRALRGLQAAGANRFYFKYCSTFDSTPAGNIGPVVEALADALGVGVVVTTPAAPIHGRTVAGGELFVDGVPLNETHMAQHPITPMRDASLVRLLAPQVAGEVDVLPLAVVRSGPANVRDAIASASRRGARHVIADAVLADDLGVIAESIEGALLAAGSAGLIASLAEREPASGHTIVVAPPGRTAIIAGSCSKRTLEQISAFVEAGGSSYRIVAQPGDTAAALAEAALAWWSELPSDESALVYSSSAAEDRDPNMPEAGELYEDVAGILARGMAARGVQRMLVAGGETSGAVIRELGATTAVVGAEAAVGAPWINDASNDVYLVLKSGNFGDTDFFVDVARLGEAL